MQVVFINECRSCEIMSEMFLNECFHFRKQKMNWLWHKCYDNYLVAPFYIVRLMNQRHI